MLRRVRDEIKITNSAYQTLYQSSVNFAMRKQLQAEHGVSDLKSEITELEKERQRMKNSILTLERRIESHKTRATERRQVDIEKRAEEIKFLEFQKKHLNKFKADVEAQ